jgi:hypothetical protein
VLGIEIRVDAGGAQLRVVDRVEIACVCNIDGVADRCPAPAVGVNGATIGYGDIVNALLPFAIAVNPTLDGLDTIEVAGPGSLNAPTINVGAVLPAGLAAG